MTDTTADRIVNPATNDKLPIKIKASFGMATFANSLIKMMITYYLLFFYTDVLMINAAVAGTIIIVAKVWDFINDPMMGMIVERTKWKGGKCRFWFRLMPIPMGVFTVLTFCAPQLPTGMKVAWAATTFVLQGMSATAVQIPFSILRPRLTTDRLERVSLTVWGGLFGAVASTLVPAITLPLIALVAGANLTRGFIIVTIMYSVVSIIAYYILYKNIEGYDNDSEQQKQQQKPPSVFKSLKSLVKNDLAVLIGLSQMAYLLVSAVITSIMVYYFTYNLGNAGLMGVASALIGVTGIITVFLMRPLAKKFGNAGTCILGLSVLLAGLVMRLVTRDAILPVMFLAMVMYAFGIMALAQMITQCMMDAIDYGRWKTGVENQALIMSLNGFFEKSGSAIGGGVAGFALAAIGYVAGAAQQSQETMNMLFALNTYIPLVFFGLVLVIYIYVHRIEKRMPQIREDLKNGVRKGQS